MHHVVEAVSVCFLQTEEGSSETLSCRRRDFPEENHASVACSLDNVEFLAIVIGERLQLEFPLPLPLSLKRTHV
jgi:hypothetical protein